MSSFLGEYECRLDAKGRIRFPAALKKQLQPDDNERFVVNRGFERCLVLYPRSKWETISSRVNKLNTFVKKNRDFVRYFFRGATELSLDGNDRLLMPKSLLGFAEVAKDVVLFAHADKIEIWDKQRYGEFLDMDSDEFAELAEEVMGDAGDEQ